jgi:minor extracellular protease Epr
LKRKEIRIPKYEVEFIISTLSQKTDWGLRQTNIPNTWKVTKGEGTTALVIDTGHPQHPDIDAIKGKNFIKNEDIIDYNGHQTHVTGIICGKNNDFGMVGVAPEAKCISVKALDRNGSGGFKGLEDALQYAIDTKPDVISMSLGAPVGSPRLHRLIKKLYDMNIPVVCAAGNSGDRGVDYPGNYPETITVAAYDKRGNIAPFSGVGKRVDWAAPGVDIYSTFLGNSYAVLSGTSMATPFITGVILLLIAKHRKQREETGQCDCNTVEEIREHLKKYTIDKGMVGKDKFFGYGIIDVEKLITGKHEKEKLNWWQKFLNWLGLK